MPKQKVTSSTGKRGVTFVRGVVEAANCLFHKIEQENDIGIDALIELIRDEEPLNRQLAVQVKAGASYFDQVKQRCILPVDGHASYWAGYPLPVYGVIVALDLQKAFWVDIKSYLKMHPQCATISFPATEANTLDVNTFTTVFVPTVLKELPDIPYEQAIRFFASSHDDEFYLGMTVLFRKFCNNSGVWDAFIDYFLSHSAQDIPGRLIYFFAHVPWHPDIWGTGEQLTEETQDYVRERFTSFARPELIKLLEFVDEDNMIARGTMGQSVEAIISSLPQGLPLLRDILSDLAVPRLIREVAGIILAINEPKDALPILDSLAKEGSWYMVGIVDHIKECGELNPYM